MAVKTILEGLNERDMQAVVNTYDLGDMYHPTLFPLKQQYSLTWKNIQADTGLNIAADVVARNSEIEPKTRDAVKRMQGDIPKIAVLRPMDEELLYQYKDLSEIAKSESDFKALIDLWAEDTKFCFDAVKNRVEWLALSSISTGALKLTTENNSGVVTSYDFTYPIPSSHKIGVSTVWSDTANAHPITVDFKNVIKNARGKGIALKFVFMSDETFAKFVEIDEVRKMSASFAQNALEIAYTPSISQVNAALSRLAYLHGLQIIVLDASVTIEKRDGERISGNPFNDNVCMFSETKSLGKTYWRKPIDFDIEGNAALHTMNGYVCVNKWGEVNPPAEFTQGVANVMPVWSNAHRCVLMNTSKGTWL